MSGFAASPAQRDKVRGASCCACGRQPCDPAHLIPRSLLTVGQEDTRAVIPLCRECHRSYDEALIDLLPHLEPIFRTELAFAVNRFGLIPTLRKVTNQRAL